MIRRYEGLLVRIYEASQKASEDPYLDPQYHWWARLIPSWIDPEFWTYYFTDEGDRGYPGRGPFQSYRFRHLFWLGRFICRVQRHPRGPIFYSSGMEPDGRCKDCGQEIA